MAVADREQGNSFPPNIDLKSSETRVAALKSPEAQMTTITEHWGQRDHPAIVEFTLNRFKGHKVTVVGHSVGGISYNLNVYISY